MQLAASALYAGEGVVWVGQLSQSRTISFHWQGREESSMSGRLLDFSNKLIFVSLRIPPLIESRNTTSDASEY
jgi:hypothetical protein